ncbi:hypothetical protein UFOVP1492_136 [uncultured Caudovirales phage]|uniref:Uncharacterized protein n=1 Tax=uncultured Caudovirales phage TaxID=2100421 RepID=A0A6J5SR00_9CAUD|nr:hypothetical protein UFOVP1127_134 [uncultured Caudovirales phage]CAB4193423.1 hypothetical protein UFOVP1242_76 [uncultured Caudovirales phage]CAB4217942.1 hypothetical protein UFOVP1492_136 [uncultured Caudovirales phage]CAB5231176.1 hypothetical protein UFOVP1580_29 [uncultured Caudovirales phage]
MEFFSKKPAIIHVETWDKKTEESAPFKSVPDANVALSYHLAGTGAIVIDSKFNDDDGRAVTALEKIGKSKLWGETSYEVKPKV